MIEIVNPSSEDKDADWLLHGYFAAGIPEYWLVDCRGDGVQFDIYKRGPKGYTATRKSGGWVMSAVLGKAFRLTRQASPSGFSRYHLDVK